MSLFVPSAPSTDALLRVLVESTASVTGQEFFDALTRTLGESLHASHVALSRPAAGRPGYIETLSGFAGGMHQPTLVYEMDHTPCKNVLGRGMVHHPENVAALFPEDHFLAETGTQSYIGVPVSTPDERSLGLLTICHDHPTHHLAGVRDLLRLFAARAAAEITRLRAEQALLAERAGLEERVAARTADLTAVTSHVPCVLWQADVEGLPGWTEDLDGREHRYLFRARIIDEPAAQRVLELRVPAGTRYLDAWYESRHPDDADAIFASTAQALIMGLPKFSREFRCLDHHGQAQWLHEEIAVDPLGPGRWRLFGVVTNVTPRKLAEQALRESEARYDLAARGGRVGIWDWDVVSGALFLSPNLKTNLGYPASEPLEDEMKWRSLLHPDDHAKIDAATKAHLAGQTAVYEMEVRRRHADGTYRHFLSRGMATRHPLTGKALRVTGSLTDITDRKRAEEALLASEAHFRTMLEQSPVATYIFAPDGRFLRCNKAAEDLYGVTAAELADYNVFAEKVHETNGVAAAYRRALAGETAPLPELSIRPDRGRRMGETIWIRGSIYPLRDAAGRVQALVAINEDVTAQKLADDALRASVDLGKRLLLELDHRVRNNLAGLLSLVSLTRERAPSVDAFAAAIDSRLRAMSHVHQVLSEARWKDLDLRSLLERFLSNARPLTPHATPVTLSGDAVLVPARLALPLTLILTEFLTNSAKYGAHSVPGGRVAVNWRLGGEEDVTLCWTESGGPPIAAEPAPSLGSALIHSFSTREMGGSCRLTYPPAGAAHTLTFPVATGGGIS